MKTRVIEQNLATPYIEISNYAMDKIRYIVENNDMEIGWMGFVDTIEGSEHPLHYKITDVVILEQHRHGTTCELDETGYDKLVHEVVEKYKDDEDEEADIKQINKLLFWGHSHVNMSTNASLQDEKQAFDFAKKGKIIRGIFNKRGEIGLSYFDFTKNIAWDDLTLHMESCLTKEDKEQLDKDFKEKLLLKTEESAFNKSTYGGYYSSNVSDNSYAIPGWTYDPVEKCWTHTTSEYSKDTSALPGNPNVNAYSVVHTTEKEILTHD